MSQKVVVDKLLEKYNPGENICKEGDIGTNMYIIKSGKVEVLKEMGNSEIKLATLGPKDFFGEMALFGERKRTAIVRAVELSEVIVVTEKMMETQYMKVPDWLVSMIKTIASRIVATTKGTKSHYKVSIDFTLLKVIYYIGDVIGTPTVKGAVIPIDVARDEIMYTTGISYDEIDIWLKRFNLVNLVIIKGNTGMFEIPDNKRLQLYTEFLYSKSREGRKARLNIDTETLKSFERIYKLLLR